MPSDYHELEMTPLLSNDCDVVIGLGITETAMSAVIAKTQDWKAFLIPASREGTFSDRYSDLSKRFHPTLFRWPINPL